MLKFKKNIARIEGVIIKCLPDNIFRVKLKSDNRVILTYLSGNMIKNHIKLIKDDIVVVELSHLDTNRGRIVFRKSN
ncbi:Protein chain initiation factor IF-1 [Candidatus Nasuia deltocephalinicola]|nr:Protein chain initiation factor IF-1 [Candidatus Nasuia deltocephalinicola]